MILHNRFSLLLTSIFLLCILAIPGHTQDCTWDLVWSDEFDNTGKLDEKSWEYEIGYVRNKELQYYSDHLQNVKVENGVCTLTARLETEDSITSASINTLGKVDLLYGRIEVRARIPSALGTWPAIWLLGINKHEMGWPACGEIDVMEHVGFNPGLIHANIHTLAYNHMINTNKGNRIDVGEPWADYHIYALEWYEDHMDFFFDDSLYFSYQNDMQGNNDTWPFDKPHYLLINLAYGGSWGGREGVDTSKLPLHFMIDYVRYYQ